VSAPCNQSDIRERVRPPAGESERHDGNGDGGFLGGHGVGLHSLPGCQIGYMDHTGCHHGPYWLSSWTILAVTNWCLGPYTLLGLSLGLSLPGAAVDWLYGPYRPSSTGEPHHSEHLLLGEHEERVVHRRHSLAPLHQLRVVQRRERRRPLVRLQPRQLRPRGSYK
jgi:hypothetical protein